MAEVSPDTPDKSSQWLRRLTGCALSGCLVICLAPFILYAALVLHGQWVAQRHQRVWDRLAIDDYRLTVNYVSLDDIGYGMPAVGVIDVCDGEIVRVDDQPCATSMFPDSCGYDPVKTLFRVASRSGRLFCWAAYDNLYHFPVRTGCGFIESSSLEVTEFQVIDCSL